MSLLDKFKKPFENIGKGKKPQNIDQGEKAKKKKDDKNIKGGSVSGGKPEKTEKKDKKEKPKKDDKKIRTTKDDTHNAYRILKHVVITEKASMIGTDRQYVFAVAPEANKVEVKKAIQSVYGVHPIKIRIINVSGKDVRYGRVTGRTVDWKKAIVTLQDGEKIDLYEGV